MEPCFGAMLSRIPGGPEGQRTLRSVRTASSLEEHQDLLSTDARRAAGKSSLYAGLNCLQARPSPPGPETRPARICAPIYPVGCVDLALRRLSREFPRPTPVHQKSPRLRLTHRHRSGCNETGPSPPRKRAGDCWNLKIRFFLAPRAAAVVFC